MTSPLSNRNTMQAASDLAADSRSLDALKREARSDPKAAAKKAATQFEALFMQMVLKSMRDATPKSGLFGNDSGHDTYTAMLDQQLATKMAASGTGLADTIARQLTRHLDTGREARAASREAPRPEAATTRITDHGSRIEDRHAELARRNDAVRAAYLNRTEFPAHVSPAHVSPADVPPAAVAPAAALPGEPAAVSDGRRGFVLRHWDHAMAAERATGVPARFIVSQAALESGWGRQEIRVASGQPSHNLFGIKAGGGWRGATAEVVTTEYENGAPKKRVEKFRAYASYGEAFRDWARLMAENPRYSQVLKQGSTGAGFAHGLQQAGYATDPNYGEKLTKVIGAVSAVRA